MVCRLFPHTLKGKSASWYFSLPANSIIDWDTFERIFRSKYVVQKTDAALMKWLCALKKERKEKVHNFTQRFVAYLKKFTAADKPFDKALIEYYTSALGPDLAMFAKISVKPMLSETYEEAERVEAEMESIENYPVQLEEKTLGGKKPLLLTKPKDERSQDFEGMLKMMQKLSNIVIDLEKEKEAHKSYNPYYKKREENSQPKTHPHNPAAMNFTDVGMDHFCTFHQ